MTIRSTVNGGFLRVKRGVVGQGIELIHAGADEANAVNAEVRESDTPAAFQTTLPSNNFNGTVV